MKVRIGFVSNSSSSSYLIVGTTKVSRLFKELTGFTLNQGRIPNEVTSWDLKCDTPLIDNGDGTQLLRREESVLFVELVGDLTYIGMDIEKQLLDNKLLYECKQEFLALLEKVGIGPESPAYPRVKDLSLFYGEATNQ